MNAEFIAKMNAAQIEQAHAAYTRLAAIYEDVCNGPYQARAYKEYFAIMDNRSRLRASFIAKTNEDNGNQ